MRIVCISDTHGDHQSYNPPPAKIIVHTGDFTNQGLEFEVDKFLLWYSNLPHPHKLLISGNHDFFCEKHPDEMRHKCSLLGITYLQDEAISILGINFYGTPWVPLFYDWAFMKPERSLAPIYSQIPKDTQVLLTHGPACYHLDKVSRGHIGSVALLEVLPTLPNLTHHICGHIHESQGKLKTTYLTVNTAETVSCINVTPNPA